MERMGKKLAAAGFFVMGLTLVGAGVGAFFSGKPLAAVLCFIVGGMASNWLCSVQEKQS